MNNKTIILGNCRLDQQSIAVASGRIAHEYAFPGTISSFPMGKGRFIVSAELPDDAKPLAGVPEILPPETILRALALDLCADPLNFDGSPAFGGEDNDASFLDDLPKEIDENTQPQPFFLRFCINCINKSDPIEKLKELLLELHCDFDSEPDGVSIYLAPNGILDLYYDSDCMSIDGEIEVTYAGAGIFVESDNIANKIAEKLDGKLEFYPFYKIMAIQNCPLSFVRSQLTYNIKRELALAALDDRSGQQGYVGWTVDSFDPMYIQGTVVTPFGRYKIETLRKQIEKYGLQVVADKYFFVRGMPLRGPDELVHSSIITMNCSIRYDSSKVPNFDRHAVSAAVTLIEDALTDCPVTAIPRQCYFECCRMLRHPSVDISKSIDMSPEFEPGYFRGDLFYGFGSYLREVLLPGEMRPADIGNDVVFFERQGKNGATLHVMTRYDMPEFDPDTVSGLEPAIGVDLLSEDDYYDELDRRIDEMYNTQCSYDLHDVTYHDYVLGCRSACRCFMSDAEGDPFGPDSVRLTVVVRIRDEQVTFLLETADDELLRFFLDSVFRARICEVDEQLYQDDESLKPRAAGAAFCRRRSDARRVDHATAMNRLESMLAPFRKPAAEIICRPEICGIAASKLGGRPFLPENFGIPRVAVTPETKADGTAGREMRLAAQINFAEMSLPGFPESGLLQLWISPGFGNKLGSMHKSPIYSFKRAQDEFRVIYHPGNYDISIEKGTEPEPRAIFKPALKDPTSGDYRYTTTIVSTLARISGQPDIDMLEYLDQKYRDPGSRIGGYPEILKFDPRESRLSGLDELIIELYSNATGEILPGEKKRSMLCLFMTREALLARDFSKAALLWERELYDDEESEFVKYDEKGDEYGEI